MQIKTHQSIHMKINRRKCMCEKLKNLANRCEMEFVLSYTSVFAGTAATAAAAVIKQKLPLLNAIQIVFFF